MTDHFIEAIKQSTTYRRKDGTETSYYKVSGAELLPERITIIKLISNNTCHISRLSDHKITCHLWGKFKKNEVSILKLHHPYHLRTNIWKIDSYSSFIGYGILGLSNESGKIDRNSVTGDLIVLHSETTDWHFITIHYFSGSAMNVLDIMEHLFKSETLI